MTTEKRFICPRCQKADVFLSCKGTAASGMIFHKWICDHCESTFESESKDFQRCFPVSRPMPASTPKWAILDLEPIDVNHLKAEIEGFHLI